MRYNNEDSGIRPINSGIPRGCVLGLIQHLLYTTGIRMSTTMTVATFADVVSVIVFQDHEIYAFYILQNAINKLEELDVYMKD